MHYAFGPPFRSRFSRAARFIGKMDEGFDLPNSRSLTHAKVLARAMMSSSTHIIALPKMNDIVKSMDILSLKKGQRTRLSAGKGGLIAVSAVDSYGRPLGLTRCLLITDRLN